MFSGLVESLTEILGIDSEPGGIRLTIKRPQSYTDVAIGDSIAISGCCLTVVDLLPDRLGFQAGEETLAKTKLGKLQVGDHVNCERSLALGDRLGGHLVTGHVDGLGKLASRRDNAEWCDMRFDAPLTLARQMAAKGSIAVDGVSLTLVDVDDQGFSIALIPHTLAATTLGGLKEGDDVNLETDLLAKYVQRQMLATTSSE
ncbi:MAG: riboflavin synthase [Aureliella sp.]